MILEVMDLGNDHQWLLKLLVEDKCVTLTSDGRELTDGASITKEKTSH